MIDNTSLVPEGGFRLRGQFTDFWAWVLGLLRPEALCVTWEAIVKETQACAGHQYVTLYSLSLRSFIYSSLVKQSKPNPYLEIPVLVCSPSHLYSLFLI